MLLPCCCLLSQQLFCSTSYFDYSVNYLSRWSRAVVVCLACFFHIQILRQSGEDKTQQALRVVPSTGRACFGWCSASPCPSPCPHPLSQQIWGVCPSCPCSFPCIGHAVRPCPPRPGPAAIRNRPAFIFLALNFNQMQIPNTLQSQCPVQMLIAGAGDAVCSPRKG